MFDLAGRVAVVTGAGDRAFCAGADLKTYTMNFACSAPHEFRQKFTEGPGFGGITRNLQIDKPIIAAVNGYAVGGGLEIAMAADIRIGRKDAGQVGLPEVSLGVLAGTGGTARLSRLVGKAKAMEIMVTGRKFSYEEAMEMDLVHDVWDGGNDQFRQDILDYAGQFTLPFAASKAIGNIKRSVQSGMEIPLEYHLALERELQSDLFQSNDAKTGIAAYVEKKTPRFEGA